MAISKEAKAAYDRARYERLRADPEWRAKQKDRWARLSDEAKERSRVYHQDWREANKERVREYMEAKRRDGYFKAKRAEWKARDPERYRRMWHGHRVAARYGISRARYQEMYEAQGGVCAICKQPEWVVYRGTVAMLSVDHDRKCCPGRKSCGQCVRALLCGRCNAALGQVNDSPDLLRAMIAYLE